MAISSDTTSRDGDSLLHHAFLAALVAVAIAIVLTSPLQGEYWWSDAPRHALNGAFILDLIRDRPFGNPVGYACG